MKKIFTMIGAFIASAIVIGNLAFAAEISAPNVDERKLTIKLVENTDASALFFRVAGLPVVDVVNIGDPNKLVLFNPANGSVLVYGLNNALIATGDLLEVELDIDYGTYEVSVVEAMGATPDAQLTEVTVGSVGVVAITFSKDELVQTVLDVLGMGMFGIDVNKDGKVNLEDVQLIANNLEI